MDFRDTRACRIISAILLFFFTWTFADGHNIAHAAWKPDTLKSPQSSSSTYKKEKSNAARHSEAVEGISKALKDKKLSHSDKKSKVASLIDEIETLDVSMRAEFAATEKRLKDKGLSDTILKRHSDFVAHYDTNMSTLKKNAAAIKKSDKATFKSAADTALKHLEKVAPPKRHVPLDPNKLPHRSVKEKKAPIGKLMRKRPMKFTIGSNYPLSQGVEVASNGSLAGLLATSAVTIAAPSSADLSESWDIKFTPAIKAKAAELGHNPHKIYEWVRNNVEYVPTWGSIQGADMCMQTMACNSHDTSSLLIALLRTSGVHARYAYATAETSMDKFANWVGGFTNSTAALDFAATGGMSVTGLREGGEIKYVRFEQVLVEAWVDMIPSLGAVHMVGDSWVTMDASFKQYEYKSAMDLSNDVPFDIDGLMSNLANSATINEDEGWVTGIDSSMVNSAVDEYRAQRKSQIADIANSVSMDEIFGVERVIKHEFSHIPLSTFYKLKSINNRRVELPPDERHYLKFEVTSDFTDSISKTYTMSVLAGKKITLSYSPATIEDEAVINSYLPEPHADGSSIDPTELPQSLPAYLINLKPELRINGNVIATGGAVTMGTTQDMRMTFIDPTHGADIINNKIVAGEFFAISLDTARISRTQMIKVAERLHEIKGELEFKGSSELSSADVYGEILYSVAVLYNARLGGYEDALSGSLGVSAHRMPSEAIFKSTLDVDTLYGTPVTVSDDGHTMDVDRNISLVKAHDGSGSTKFDFLYFSGVHSSVQEHRVPESLLSIPNSPASGVSALKALQIANDNMIPIYSVTRDNIETVLPLLQLNLLTINDIRNAVNAGNVVIVSQTNIDYHGWIGCGYVVMDPSAGAARYMISGGESGAKILSINFSAMIGIFDNPDIGFMIFEAAIGIALTRISDTVGFGTTEPIDWCGSGFTSFIPDYPFGIDASAACSIHDNCYKAASEWGDWNNKIGCDENLADDIIHDCIDQKSEVAGSSAIGLAGHTMCGFVGYTYQSAVMLAGWVPWVLDKF